ncbi:hypothetical protein BV22DRAFT_1031670 [Leucogyrophana mollusca]|uniref:Uncharacterized protein n=1 Tax=Leucogyrophana mollusca TaxID=85980 RepID=A0ACB8BPV4_9AGAM|nr:hypothetical protein BV22DRAFT_1031670 [Leucogyrophana mollusca]
MSPTYPARVLSLLLVLLTSLSVHAQYFIVNQPGASSTWKNGAAYPVSWTKGLLDGIDTFDIELTRLSQDGLIYVAMNVQSTYKTLNVLLNDVPPADDYFLLCLNSTHGITYAVSSRFTVAAANSTASQPGPDSAAPTVTVSGAPNPLVGFARTFGPEANGVRGTVGLGWEGQAGGVLAVLGAMLVGAVVTIW